MDADTNSDADADARAQALATNTHDFKIPPALTKARFRATRRKRRLLGSALALFIFRKLAKADKNLAAILLSAGASWVCAKSWSSDASHESTSDSPSPSSSNSTWEAALFGWIVGTGRADSNAGSVNFRGEFSRAARRAELALAGKICNNNNTDDLRRILGRLPLWVTFPDFETCRWLNRAFAKVWPRYKRLLAAEIKHHAELHVNRKLPEGIAEFRFDALDLGATPPEVSGIKSYEGGGASEIIIDLEVRWISNAASVLAVRLAGGAVTLPVECTEVSFLGLVRVALRPLRDHWCFFETVSVSLLPSPELDFALRLLGGGDVRTIPGLHEALEEMLRRRALSALTWPRAVGASISTRAKQAANVARAQRAARARAGAGGSGSAGKAGASSSSDSVPMSVHRLGGGIGPAGAGGDLLSGADDETLAHPLLRRCCSGIVLVRLLSAKGLRGHSWWLWLTGGAPDSCVSFEVQGEGAAQLRSEVRSNSANPRWGEGGKGAEPGEEFELLVGDPVTQAVRLRVMNTARTLNYVTGGQQLGIGSMSFPSEEVIGEALIPISRVTHAQADREVCAESTWGTGLNVRVPLGEGNGSCHVNLQYYPLHPFGYQPRAPSAMKSALKAPAPSRRQRRRVRIAPSPVETSSYAAAEAEAPAPAPLPASSGKKKMMSVREVADAAMLATPAPTLKGIVTPTAAPVSSAPSPASPPKEEGNSSASSVARAAPQPPTPIPQTPTVSCRGCLAIHRPAGVLTVLVHAARHLPARHEWASAGDPFVELTVGKQRRRGSTRRRTHHPTWGELFDVVIHERPDELDGEITLEVWSQDALLPDCVLGTASIPLADVRQGEASGRHWWPLQLETSSSSSSSRNAPVESNAQDGEDDAAIGSSSGAAAIDITLLWRVAVAPPMPPSTALASSNNDALAVVMERATRVLELARTRLTPSQSTADGTMVGAPPPSPRSAAALAAANASLAVAEAEVSKSAGGGGGGGGLGGMVMGGLGAAGRGVGVAAGVLTIPFRRRRGRGQSESSPSSSQPPSPQVSQHVENQSSNGDVVA
ncbi:hypothetical protein PPROV_000593400 [Pycnococcus provasolii]|uniref:C2 domain-containing protein n=1 Tax=Pycnococcus provasolii TaxID=41880 RepID=A0A830HJZ6_9CHLO|nr:hypothetical protein PPROV_000593400 [Pycnococcus provasolii]